MDRSGPVPAAVRAAGYLSEEEDEEEEGGSSVEEESDVASEVEEEEEEEDEEDEHEHHSRPHGAHASQHGVPDSVAHDAAPSYSGPAEGSNIQMVRGSLRVWLSMTLNSGVHRASTAMPWRRSPVPRLEL